MYRMVKPDFVYWRAEGQNGRFVRPLPGERVEIPSLLPVGNEFAAFSVQRRGKDQNRLTIVVVNSTKPGSGQREIRVPPEGLWGKAREGSDLRTLIVHHKPHPRMFVCEGFIPPEMRRDVRQVDLRSLAIGDS